MFILRRITSEARESNQILGDSYHLILEERNPEEFQEVHTKIMKWKEKDPDIYGFVYTASRSLHIPLYKKSVYFIMCSDGKEFENLSKL